MLQLLMWWLPCMRGPPLVLRLSDALLGNFASLCAVSISCSSWDLCSYTSPGEPAKNLHIRFCLDQCRTVGLDTDLQHSLALNCKSIRSVARSLLERTRTDTCHGPAVAHPRGACLTLVCSVFSNLAARTSPKTQTSWRCFVLSVRAHSLSIPFGEAPDAPSSCSGYTLSLNCLISHNPLAELAGAGTAPAPTNTLVVEVHTNGQINNAKCKSNGRHGDTKG